MERNYPFRSQDLVERAKNATNLEMDVRYWNCKFHITIDGKHKFAGSESECEAYLYGITAVIPMMTKA